VAGYFSYAQRAAHYFDRPHEEPLDDLNVEFPLPDTELYGARTRYSYQQHLPESAYTVEFRALVKYDHDDGSCVRYDHPDGWLASESPFARRVGGSGEDDGYVVTLAVHAGSFESQCWIFSARVPTGFHAKWIPGDKLWPNT